MKKLSFLILLFPVSLFLSLLSHAGIDEVKSAMTELSDGISGIKDATEEKKLLDLCEDAGKLKADYASLEGLDIWAYTDAFLDRMPTFVRDLEELKSLVEPHLVDDAAKAKFAQLLNTYDYFQEVLHAGDVLYKQEYNRRWKSSSDAMAYGMVYGAAAAHAMRPHGDVYGAEGLSLQPDLNERE